MGILKLPKLSPNVITVIDVVLTIEKCLRTKHIIRKEK